jgi:tetratricopeptide (TPR) repeat protein
VSSDATPDRRPDPEPEATAEQYLQRAVLLADLGRYEEAAGELASAVALAPRDGHLLTTLARVHLAAGQPREALAAAERAIGAQPGGVDPLVARGMALTDLRRFAEAAEVGEQILRLGPDDAYAQRSGAAILGQSRNGQEALNAAWRAVKLAPEEAQGHLVLGVVAARLRLFDLAERAYREALRLDPELAGAQRDVGVIRLEQRRYAEALEQLADAAVIPDLPAAAPGGDAGPFTPEPGRPVGDAVRQLVLYGAGYALVAAVFAAFMAGVNAGVSRVWAALMALAGVLGVWALVARLPGSVRSVLAHLAHADRPLALAGCATVAAPLLILLYAVVGGPWPLVLAIAMSAAAELVVVTRRHAI